MEFCTQELGVKVAADDKMLRQAQNGTIGICKWLDT